MGELGEPRNLYAYTAMLTVCKDNQRWEESTEVFRAMRDEEVGPGPGSTARTVRGIPTPPSDRHVIHRIVRPRSFG